MGRSTDVLELVARQYRLTTVRIDLCISSCPHLQCIIGVLDSLYELVETFSSLVIKVLQWFQRRVHQLAIQQLSRYPRRTERRSQLVQGWLWTFKLLIESNDERQ